MTPREKIRNLRATGNLVLPSMLLCDFGDLKRQVERLEAAGFRALHLDVMDGVFVPNFSYGMTIVRAFRQITDMFLDVHLMMVDPSRHIDEFCEAGADLLTFHIETVDNATEVVEKIRSHGVAAGVAIDRDTPVSEVEAVAPLCDLALVMTIKAGFGGQKFIPGLLDKLDGIRKFTDPETTLLQVDGGVNASTIQACVEAGAEWLVAGSAVFGSDDYDQTHRTLRELANDGAECGH